MNRTAKANFDGINVSMLDYRVKVKEALARYKAEKKKAEESVSKYQEAYKKEALAAAMQEPTTTAKAAIRQAGKEFQVEMRRHVTALRQELERHLTAPMDANFSQQLKIYREFGIAPSKTETQMLLRMNGGSTLGIRALAAVLEATGANVRLQYRKPDEYVRDLEKLERVTAAAVNPVFSIEDANTALELFRGEPWLSVRPDGSTFNGGAKVSFLSLNADSALFESLQNSLDKMGDVWQADVSYKIEDVVDAILTEREWKEEAAAAEREGREPQPAQQPESTTQFEPEGIMLAREIGQQTARATKTSDLLKGYVR